MNNLFGVHLFEIFLVNSRVTAAMPVPTLNITVIQWCHCLGIFTEATLISNRMFMARCG
jgi:hypothetical protein